MERCFSLRKDTEEFVEADRSIQEHKGMYKGIQCNFFCPVFSQLSSANFPSKLSLHFETMSASSEAETYRQLRACCQQFPVIVRGVLLTIR